jgi:hypothetical protein
MLGRLRREDRTLAVRVVGVDIAAGIPRARYLNPINSLLCAVGLVIWVSRVESV